MLGVAAMIGWCGRRRVTREAVRLVDVGTTMARHRASPRGRTSRSTSPGRPSGRSRARGTGAVADAGLDDARDPSMYATDSIGYSPTAVSPRASPRSSRRGSRSRRRSPPLEWALEAWIIDSSICVAVITGFPRSSALDDLLLEERHAAGLDLHAEVAARDHDRVRLLEHVVEGVDGLGLLDLGDDPRGRARMLDQLAQVTDVGRRAHEGARRSRRPARARAPGRPRPARQRRNRHRDARNVDALVRDATRPPETTSQRARPSTTLTTRSLMRPSSISTSCPGERGPRRSPRG